MALGCAQPRSVFRLATTSRLQVHVYNCRPPPASLEYEEQNFRAYKKLRSFRRVLEAVEDLLLELSWEVVTEAKSTTRTVLTAENETCQAAYVVRFDTSGHKLHCRTGPQDSEVVVLSEQERARSSRHAYRLHSFCPSVDFNLAAFTDNAEIEGLEFLKRDQYSLFLLTPDKPAALSKLADGVSGPIAWSHSAQLLFYTRKKSLELLQYDVANSVLTLCFTAPKRCSMKFTTVMGAPAVVHDDYGICRGLQVFQESSRAWIPLLPVAAQYLYQYDYHAHLFVALQDTDQAEWSTLIVAGLLKLGQPPVLLTLGYHAESLAVHDNIAIVVSSSCNNNTFTLHVHAYTIDLTHSPQQPSICSTTTIDIPLEHAFYHIDPPTIHTTGSICITYSSIGYPPTTVTVDLATGHWALQRSRLHRRWPPSSCTSARLEAQAADGAYIPISLCYRNDKVTRGVPAPLLLHVYGAYGEREDVRFNPMRCALMAAGFIVAVAHLRGGGERGVSWHKAARGALKPVTSSDLQACADMVVAQGWTSPAQLVLEGSSAASWAVLPLINRRPDVCRAVALCVPCCDPAATLTSHSSDHDELGDPWEEPQALAAVQSWSPLLNLAPQPYPALLIQAAASDMLVPITSTCAYVARLRQLRTNDDQPLLLQVKDGGHDCFETPQDESIRTAFLIHALGLAGPEPLT